jgi:hypothetical protein
MLCERFCQRQMRKSNKQNQLTALCSCRGANVLGPGLQRALDYGCASDVVRAAGVERSCRGPTKAVVALRALLRGCDSAIQYGGGIDGSQDHTASSLGCGCHATRSHPNSTASAGRR